MVDIVDIMRSERYLPYMRFDVTSDTVRLDHRFVYIFEMFKFHSFFNTYTKMLKPIGIQIFDIRFSSPKFKVYFFYNEAGHFSVSGLERLVSLSTVHICGSHL